MPILTAELRDPIRASLRECLTLSAALAHTADSIRARTEDRNAQIDLGVLQRLGGDLEMALSNLSELIDELLRETPESLPVIEKALAFYGDAANYQTRRGSVAVVVDGGSRARAAARAMRGEDVAGSAE